MEPPHWSKSRPLWLTNEFILYYFVLAYAIWETVATAWKFSSDASPNHRLFSTRLDSGWMFGRMLDNSDYQYRSFRAIVPHAALVLSLYAIANQTIVFGLRRANVPLQVEMTVRAAFAVVGVFAVHGFHFVKILAIVTANFFLGKFCGPYNPGLTWIFALLTLLGLEKAPRFASVWPWLSFMDEFGGLYPRWWVTFNLCVLRLISFNLDFYFAPRTRDILLKKHQQDCRECVDDACEKLRAMSPHSPDRFTFASYLAYVFYLPLFVAGPIITFNNFMAQVEKRPKSLTISSLVWYGIRLGAAMLLVEAMLHLFYVVAIKDTRAWSGFSALDFAVLGFLNLKMIWLKLLVIWRFFRFFAQCDGIQPPENMVRCMANNYSAMGFWRGWHRSFNLWIVRYMYIPLGGALWSPWNIWPIFTFVAVWHDMELKLLVWGWLVCLFMVPELLGRHLARRWNLSAVPSYRHICALAAALNIELMMIANLIGFAIGIDGIKLLLGQIYQPHNLLFVMVSFVTLFAASQIMFEIRQSEARNNDYKNY